MSRSAALGPEAEVRLRQGRIRYRATGPADGPVLVFTHPFLFNGDMWRNVVPALSGRYRCISPDWPMGSHEIPLTRPTDLSPPALARLSADFLEALGLERVTLVGNDSAIAAVQCAAVLHPERIARIVVTPYEALERYPPAPFRVLRAGVRLPGAVWLMMQALRIPAMRRLPLTFGRYTRRPIEPAAMRSYLAPALGSREIRRDIRTWLRSLDPEWTARTVRRLSEFTGPALVVWAADDPVLSAERGRRLPRLLPEARHRTVADSRAGIPEDQPTRLAEVIHGFLTETDDLMPPQPPPQPR
ncbi:alpha/beta fold hydrolase [Thermomonospora umbrina]|uniref:Pimeloyl-ACP methyl ester carboxylesterase n=1 Tax=Thermomonospora umbrina TaxID=111806 RepID=A0A3D9SPD1_9ACTN|nr:alpha/beta hydrolase [Thermomonospora umbrina]REE97768.1 pimeloyl-ACP methyl ester carboxylesterase [Thermomonospora umbrina]